MPDERAQQLSEQVVQQCRRVIHAHGRLSFAQYMEIALYLPGLGYYANNGEKFGIRGDFVTAPEISPLFGACMARQVADVLARLHDGAVLELGAGSGALAESALLALSGMDVLPSHYFILEPSASLQQQQRERLQASLPAALFERVSWLSCLPKSFSGVVLANEVMDALPVEVVRIFPDDARQAFVTWDEALDKLVWDWQVITDSEIQQRVNRIRDVVGEVSAQGYTTEICTVLSAWVASLADMLMEGAIVLVDYGYPRREYLSPNRWMGTLRAHYRQRAHQDVFWYPGLQDMTAHVDFTAVAESGCAQGLTLAGYTTQANFLLALGIVGMIDASADVVSHLKLAQQIKTLTMPDEMGENFKVIAFTKGIEGALAGFAMRDLRMML